MAKYKRLNSVSHSMAHHAVSALSYLHPHLGEACEKTKINTVKVNLLSENVYPNNLKKISELELSLNALKETFVRILQSEGFDMSIIKDAALTFYFSLERKDNYCSICNSKIIDKDDKVYEYTVDCMGKVVNT